MARCHHFLLVVLTLITCVKAAPSDVSRLEDIIEIEKENIQKSGQESNNEPIRLTDDIKKDDDSTQGQRQKRWYNFYGYGIPPMNPVIYPNYKRDETSQTSVFGENPFGEVYRRLQEIATVARQPVVPPPPLQYPTFFPVVYIPYVGCTCTPENIPPTTDQNSGTTPEISNRFPEMDDNRQNWGFVVNDTADFNGTDFTRPISFDPIQTNNTVSRPPPPVEHGSSQATADSQNNIVQSGTATTTVSSSKDEENLSASLESPDALSVCDGAILSCCHQPQVTYDCFASQGCSDLSPYGNPCEVDIILKIIQKFQNFYGQRTV